MPSLPKIDAHQHYWDAARTFPVGEGTWFMGVLSYPWKQAELPELNRSFLPEELEPQLEETGVGWTILVHALHSPAETRWLLDLADAHPSVAGVVGWLNLAQPAELVSADLDAVRRHPKLVGIRHLAQFEPDPRWLLRPDVVSGLKVLETGGVPFDLLLRPEHLGVVPELSARLPDLPMVIDHLAKPHIRDRVLEPWASQIRAAAENPRLHCKLSGLVTEADVEHWTPADLLPYVEVVVEAFGPDRLMYGSDWPVCTLAASYRQVHESLAHCVARVIGNIEDVVERAIFFENAVRFYGLGQSIESAGAQPG
jgi:L-fuconolactonase